MPRSKIDIVCIGHASYDMVLHVGSYPQENSKIEIHTAFNSGGGPAANAAFLLSKWGVRTAFAGLVGNDEYGRVVANEFTAVGTDISFLEISKTCATPLSVILVNESNGSRTIVNRKSSTQKFTLPYNVSVLNPSVLLFDGHELEASLTALELFPNAITILDAGSLRPGTEQLAKKVDYLVASERFTRQFCEIDDLQDKQAQIACLDRLRFQKLYPVVVTLGERGLIYSDETGFHQMPAIQVETVDTTAAGDIFHGAFAYGILNKIPFTDTLKNASMAAAISVTKSGGRDSIPELPIVQEKLACL